MSNEHKLAKLLQAASKAPCPISFWSEAYSEPTGYGKLFAGAILAAGYRKPRTITTDSDLRTLPENSVIRDQNEVLVLAECDGYLDWLDIWGNECDVRLPATVLHEAVAT